MVKYKGMEVHPDVVKSIKMVNQMASYISRKYNISNKEARKLIDKASEYNVKNKKEAYIVIDRLYMSNLR